MEIGYSPSARGFWLQGQQGAPDDLVMISEAAHAALIAAQAAGKVIVPGTDGVPVLADPPPPDLAMLRGRMQLTRQQLISGMLIDGLITPAEAVAAATARTLPAAVEAVVAAMPEPQQSLARIKWADFTVADRLDPMVALFAAAASPPLTETQIDDFFARHRAL